MKHRAAVTRPEQRVIDLDVVALRLVAVAKAKWRLALPAGALLVLVVLTIGIAITAATDDRLTPADVVASSPEAEVVKMCGAVEGEVSPARVIGQASEGSDIYAVPYTDSSGTTWAAYILESSGGASYGLGNCHEWGPITAPRS